MNYQKVKPRIQLAPFIDSIWIQKNDSSYSGTSFPTIVLPTTTIDLVFHFGDPFVEIDDNGSQHLLPKIYITGQKTKPLKVKAKGRTGIILVSFKPWGLFHLLQIPANEFKDASVPLADIIGHERINEIEQKLIEAQTIDTKVDIMQSFLCDFLKASDSQTADRLIIEAAHKINEAKGVKGIAEIKEDFFISKRHFIRRFQKVMGLNPKEFSNIIRFQKSLLYTNLQIPVENIISDLGYYDQSHLLHEVKKMSGYSRSAISKKYNSTNLKQIFNSTHDMALFYNTIYL
jgi:AraC-like DNA-binding protein